MYAALRRLRHKLLLHRNKQKTQHSSGIIGPRRPTLLTRLQAAVRIASAGHDAASTAGSQEALNGSSPLSVTYDPVPSIGVLVRPGRSRLGSGPTPHMPQHNESGDDDGLAAGDVDEGGTKSAAFSASSDTPPPKGVYVGSSSVRKRRLYQQQQSRKLESSAHLPTFHLRMRMDKYISRALTVLARVSSKAPQTSSTVGGPCVELTQAAGLAFTFSRKVGVGFIGGQRARGFVLQKLDRQAVGGDRDAGVHLSAPVFFKSRSCVAGLQAGAAKCQTLTLFTSRHAVENFIGKHAAFEASPGSITVPLLKGPKSRSVSIALPGRFNHSQPSVNHQYSVACGAYCDLLPISGGAVKLDGRMMEGVYGRGVSAIEVLRGWEPAPPQFKALHSALQTWPGPSRHSLPGTRRNDRSATSLPASSEDACAPSAIEAYNGIRHGASNNTVHGVRATRQQSSNSCNGQADDQQAQLAAQHGAAWRTASQSHLRSRSPSCTPAN